MLDNVSKQIRECLEHAEKCARNAQAHPDGSPLREDYLRLEKRWLELARSFASGEQLTDFTKGSTRDAIAPITPFLPGQAFDPETVKAIGKALVTTCVLRQFNDLLGNKLD